MLTIISGDEMNALAQWLLGREDDIAHGMEDLGELREVFLVVFGREAEKDAGPRSIASENVWQTS